MRGWLAALRTELRSGIAPWVLLAVTLTMVALLWLDHSSDWGGRWNSLGRFIRELVIVLGPVCVTLGAWQGGRRRRTGVNELLASTARTALKRQSVEIAALCVAISVGVLLGWASAAWTIVLVGGWGSLAAAWYLLGIFPAVLAYTTAGYAIGSIAPWRIVAPMAGAATYLGVGITAWSSDKIAVPMGGGWLGGTAGYPFDLDALLLSMVVLLLAALALWGLASAERRPGASRSWLPVLVVGALGAGLVAPLSVSAADSGSPDLQIAKDTPVACTTDEPQVCVLAEDRLLLPETTARARPVLIRLAEIPGAPTKAGPHLGDPDGTVLGVAPGATTPWGNVDRKWGGEVYIELFSLFGPDSYCSRGRYGQAPSPVLAAFQGPTDLLVTWLDSAALGTVGPEDLLDEGGTPGQRELTARFVSSTEQQRTDYAAGVLAASRACDIAAVQTAADALAPAP